ncbi:acetyltransferase [Encephalitozoon hellem]|nr:acetyltransferase [Encephalitozoon hellem]
MNLDDEQVAMLKNDPEFVEYYEAIGRKYEAEESFPSVRFLRRNVEVTQIMLGNELLDLPNRIWLFSDKSVVYICDQCLLQYWDSVSFDNHKKNCTLSIPGRCVYTDEEENIFVLEIDGKDESVLCRRICTIGKAFIRRKTLYLDVDGYLFYILFTEGKFSGFFSKEKESTEHNLSCLLVLPPYRSKGYGTLLVDLSYALGTGTPEKPLSKEGRAVYKKYWRNKVLSVLQGMADQEMSIKDISTQSGLSIDDTIHGLELLDINPESDTYDVSGKASTPFRECKKDRLVL